MFERFKRFFGRENGQSTTEYALVLLAVVAIAGVLSKVGVSGMTDFLTGVFAKLAAGVK
jgi:Flp pilus assembly pilin Flp